MGGHAFLVTAVDGGRSGADLVSLTVWDPRGRLLYSAGPIRLAGGGIVTSPRR